MGEGDSRREFLVGAGPHSDQKGTVFDAPGTRGYIAICLQDPGQSLLFLKDTWRIANHGFRPEGRILQYLNTHDITYVPTLVYSADVRHDMILADQQWHKTHHRSRYSQTDMQHYRIVVQEVAMELSTFNDSKALLHAMSAALPVSISPSHHSISRLTLFLAHTRAMELPIVEVH